MKGQTKWILLEVLLLMIILGLTFSLYLNLNKAKMPQYPDRGLPIIALNLNDFGWSQFKEGG